MDKRLPSAPPILAGLTVVRPLGSGGFADVFLYAQDMPRRDVAVKVLPGDAADADLVRMFNAEADVLARLSAHPAIVTVYQAGLSADGRPYIVMEYCPGSLGRRYRHERIPVAEAVDIGVRMAGALETSHRAGLLHRDVKPSNILITSFGSPVLADFGIASALSPSHADRVLAMSVPWSAPEVVAERTPGTVASEVWALAATVYSLLAGHSPFERRDRGQNTREQLRQRILRASLTPLGRRDVPSELEEALRHGMSRSPGDRPDSAAQFGEMLRGVQLSMGEQPTPLTIAESAWTPPARPEDFADAVLRGLAPSHVPVESTRKAPGRVAIMARGRDEDRDAVSPGKAKRVWPWALGGAVVVVVGVAAGLVGLVVGAGGP